MQKFASMYQMKIASIFVSLRKGGGRGVVHNVWYRRSVNAVHGHCGPWVEKMHEYFRKLRR